MAGHPLDGLRVLDVSRGIAGAYATKLLVDLGADVVIIEPPGGDPLRSWTAASTPLAPGEDGVLFRFLRSSTRSAATADGLAATADVVVASEVLPVSPTTVLVTITPWGTTGPRAAQPATEFTVQAACGGTARRGLPDRPPVSAGGQLVEWITGAFAAVGALTGWLHASRTGAGQHVDVSMLEAANLCLNGPYTAIASQWYPALTPGRTIEVPSIEPAADGPVGFCTMTAQQWSDFCVLIGRPDFADDPDLRSADQRMGRIVDIRAAIATAIHTLPVDEVVELAAALRVPVTPVGNGATITTLDHVVARQIYHAGPDGLRRPRPPFRFSRSEVRAAGAWPASPEAGVAWAAGGVQPAPRPAPEGPWPALAAPPTGRPLDGLRVADLSAFWAGPFATLYLGAFGADVIKIESTRHPDGIRFLGGFAGEAPWETSMVFAGANPGKRDLTLDLDNDEGRDLLWRLLEGADVVIENFTPRVLERFGVTWEELHRRNPAALLVRMPAFGLDGPWRDRSGFAMTIEQTSGLAWVTGYEDLPLVPRGPCDPSGGMLAVAAILAGLQAAEGQLIEVPLLDGALGMAAEQVLEFERTGEVLGRHANRGVGAPQGLYRCAGDDRWVAVAVVTDAQWAALCGVLGLDRAGETRSGETRTGETRTGETRTGQTRTGETRTGQTRAGRLADHDELDRLIGAWTATRSAEEAAAELGEAGVPAAEVTPAYLAHLDPQLAHRGFLQPLEHTVTGHSGYPGFPMLFSAFGPGLYRSPPPRLGQHNEEILLAMGLSADDLAGLVDRKIIGDRPAWVD